MLIPDFSLLNRAAEVPGLKEPMSGDLECQLGNRPRIMVCGSIQLPGNVSGHCPNSWLKKLFL